MKEQILALRKQGKTYTEIKEILNCSKSTISYYCGKDQKIKNLNRTRKRRLNVINNKFDNFKKKKEKAIKEGLRRFQKRDQNEINPNLEITFTIKDIINKFGEETICYLTGEKINLLTDKDYSFDHIKPASKGGLNTIDNLGITKTIANRAKTDLELPEFLELCKKVLIQHNLI